MAILWSSTLSRRPRSFRSCSIFGRAFDTGSPCNGADDVLFDCSRREAGRIEQRLMIEDGKSGKSMAFACFKVVEVVCRRDLDGTGAELEVDEDGVTHDWNVAPRERQADCLADEMAIAWIVRVYGHRGVAEHGFRTRGRDDQAKCWDRPRADIGCDRAFPSRLHARLRCRTGRSDSADTN